MPIIKEVKLQCQCPCKPKAILYGVGTIWECDDCKQRYKRVDHADNGMIWEYQRRVDLRQALHSWEN